MCGTPKPVRRISTAEGSDWLRAFAARLSPSITPARLDRVNCRLIITRAPDAKDDDQERDDLTRPHSNIEPGPGKPHPAIYTECAWPRERKIIREFRRRKHSPHAVSH